MNCYLTPSPPSYQNLFSIFDFFEISLLWELFPNWNSTQTRIIFKLRQRSFYKYKCLSVGLSVCRKNCFTLKNTFESLTYKSKVFRLCGWIPNKFLDIKLNCNWTALAQINPLDKNKGTRIHF